MSAPQGTFLSPAPLHTAWGQRRIVKPPIPAAGKDFLFTVPGSQLLRVVSLLVTLKASAQAAKRVPALEVQDGDGGPLMVIPGTQEVAENLTRTITFAPGIATDSTVAAAGAAVGIPDLLLPPGYAVGTKITGIQTEDQIEKVVLWVEEHESSPDHPLADMVQLIHKVIRTERALEYATG